MSGTIGSRIRLLRKKKGLTQHELAEKIGRTRSAVAAMERNQSTPPSDIMAKIIEVLGTSADFLMGNTLSTLPPAATERYIDVIELSDEKLFEKMTITIDRKIVTSKEMGMLVDFLRRMQE